MGRREPLLSGDAVEYLNSLLPPELADNQYVAPPEGLRVQPTVGPQAAQLLHVLVSTRRPGRILELGTCFGFAAIMLGQAARAYGGHVTTVELDERLVAVARENIAAADLDETVDVVCADGREFVSSDVGPFGLILQDANKDLYEPLLPRLVELLEPAGLLVSDDVLFPIMDLPDRARRWQDAIERYNQALREHPLLSTVWLPIGDGVAVSVKTGPER